MTDDVAPYRLLDALDGVSVPAGTNLLVTASEPAGTRFLYRLLAQGRRDGEELLVLTADDPAGDVAADVAAMTGEAGADAVDGIHVIDCQTDDVAPADDSVVTQNVNTPRNLTDIGIGFKDAFDGFDAAGVEWVRFGLVSLSVVLSYVDRETVYRFCRTLTRGVDQEDALGLFLLNDAAHDEGTINTLRRAFDGTLAVDSTGDELSVRIQGLDGVGDEWRTVEPGE